MLRAHERQRNNLTINMSAPDRRDSRTVSAVATSALKNVDRMQSWLQGPWSRAYRILTFLAKGTLDQMNRDSTLSDTNDLCEASHVWLGALQPFTNPQDQSVPC